MKGETILSLLGEPTYKNQLKDSIGQIFEHAIITSIG